MNYLWLKYRVPSDIFGDYSACKEIIFIKKIRIVHWKKLQTTKLHENVTQIKKQAIKETIQV